MKPESENNKNTLWIYLGKIFITAFLFYATADLAQNLGFIKIFSHDEYTIFWPPSGIALGLMLTWGRSTLSNSQCSLVSLFGSGRTYQHAIHSIPFYVRKNHGTDHRTICFKKI